LSNFEEELIQSLVKKNLDIIILSMLKDNPIQGYKIIADLHSTFGVLLSPGTLYPLLYRLVSEGLIDMEVESRRKLYSLTVVGERKTREFVDCARARIILTNGIKK
jgi:DNA-binding PadR family transcriptional regulator